MTAYSSAGTVISISAGNPATFDGTGFAALTYTAIGEVTAIDGDIGRIYAVVKHNPLSSRSTVKKKGSYDSGSMKLQLALDNDDAGQTLGKTALSSVSEYSFKLLLQSGDIYYFRGIVTGFPVTPAGVDAITTASLTVEITADSSGNDFVLVNAA